MPTYAEQVLRLAEDWGKPQTTVQTTTGAGTTEMTQPTGIDLGPLLMMLMFSDLFNGDKSKTAETLGITGVPEARFQGAGGTDFLNNVPDFLTTAISGGTESLGTTAVPPANDVGAFLKMLGIGG